MAAGENISRSRSSSSFPSPDRFLGRLSPCNGNAWMGRSSRDLLGAGSRWPGCGRWWSTQAPGLGGDANFGPAPHRQPKASCTLPRRG